MKDSIVVLIEPLTPGEKEVLEGMAKGKTGPQIAVNLFLSPHTVRTHANRILEKLGAHTRMEAVLTAHELGLVTLPNLPVPEVVVILAIERMRPGTLDEALAVLNSEK